MSQKHLESSRNSIESCTLQLLSWRPFHRSKALDSSEQPQTKTPYSSVSTKRPCFSDRSTTSFSIEAMSRLSLADEDNNNNGGKLSSSNYNSKGSFRLVARKRRRRNSRSVSGRSSDRSGTLRCCSIGAAHGTCSDFPFAVGTDSSGELFSEANWASDVSEARRSRRDSGGEKEASGFGFPVGVDPMGNESGYGSEPGYRGDVEFGYGDEYDDEEEDVRPLFWGDSTMEVSGDTKFSDSKPQFRCRRRRQHDYKTVDSMR
ncbi:unnamed protein product [Eruca vesicaria subsp. sativa]|uniref:Uncharacterized protein n=1 Tax=Eruca vesicaria subsp. sativa TaxID=29727 RepID=A0ABC8K9G6_ERUVS|nr:unnamed protein product [Eruca vesicaria subsp. sativa]